MARTAFADEAGAWYALDNAGIIMPAVSDDVNTNFFRFEAVLDHEVDRAVLDRALSGTASRFRYFDVQLRRGFFWHYTEPCRTPIRSEEDSPSPCEGVNINRHGTRLFRVRCSGRTVAGEFSHALTDGYGAMSFLKSLVVEYFRLRGTEPGASLGEACFDDIHAPGSVPESEEYEDGYRRHFAADLPHPKPGEGAWQIGKERLPPGTYRIIDASLPLDAVLTEARKHGASLTEFLAAVYIDSLQELWLAAPRRPRRHLLSVEIPVNMRKFFPSKTKRNFSLFVLVTQDMRLGRRGFEEILGRAHHQLRIENDPRSIARQITRNVAGTRNLLVRLVPLGIKDFFARQLYSAYGENMLSGFISNLGSIVMPPGPAEHIVRWNFIPAPSVVTMTNASVLSWKDRLYLSFGSLARSRELERLFFTRLRGMGLVAKIDCRLAEE